MVWIKMSLQSVAITCGDLHYIVTFVTYVISIQISHGTDCLTSGQLQLHTYMIYIGLSDAVQKTT